MMRSFTTMTRIFVVYHIETCYKNGLFPQELCFFECDGLLKIKNLKNFNMKVNNVKGGAMNNNNTNPKKKDNKNNDPFIYPDANISQEEWNKEETVNLRKIGYTGEIKFTKWGTIERIGFKKIMKNLDDNNYKIIQQKNKEFNDKYCGPDNTISMSAFEDPEVKKFL